VCLGGRAAAGGRLQDNKEPDDNAPEPRQSNFLKVPRIRGKC
jgi:hypothetical protein